MATDEAVASLYYGAVHPCFFRDDETSACQYLEECDSIEGALAKLKVQKDHVENKIRKFTETQRGQLVAGCMDVVNARAGYVRVKDKIQAHRENLLNSAGMF